MYNRRSKINPLWNTVVIGGFYNGERWVMLLHLLPWGTEAAGGSGWELSPSSMQPPRSRLCPVSFLGYVDMLGVAYEAPTLATGYGAYLAQVELALAWLSSALGGSC